MTAALDALRRAYPKAEIHVVVTSNWAPLLENHPGVDKIWPYERKKETTARARAIARLAFRLRKESFDCAINLHASPSSSILAFGTGAPVRSIHFHGHNHRNRYSTVDIPGKGAVKPITERDMDTIRALDIYIPEGLTPRVYLDSAEFVRGEEYIFNMGLNNPVLALGLGASRPTKIWPLERFAALAIRWCDRTGGSAISVVAGNEEALNSDFNEAVDEQLELIIEDSARRKQLRDQIKNLVGIPIRHLASVLRHCDVLVGNDSGPRHLAVSVQTPTITLIGPEHPYEWHPYPTDIHPYMYIENLACRKDAAEGMPAWCGLEICTVERHQCMKQIKVDQVLEKCFQVTQL